MKMGAEVAEKWTARAIPLISGALGGALNYYFVREWGKRAKKHFRERHRTCAGAGAASGGWADAGAGIVSGCEKNR